MEVWKQNWRTLRADARTAEFWCSLGALALVLAAVALIPKW